MKGLIRNLLTTGMFALAVATTPGLQGTAWAVDVEGLEIVAGDTTDVLIRLTDGADGAAVSAFTMSDPRASSSTLPMFVPWKGSRR